MVTSNYGEKSYEKAAIINDVKIILQEPDTPRCFWIGQEEVFRLLSAAWLKSHENDRIMTPVLTGSPGCGKTTLACTVAQKFDRPIYLMNCTSDMRPEDLLITPVLSQDNQILYRASSLVSAMINGGICILDEANRMNEKTWASLAPLLDDRRYIDSVTSCLKVHAHPEFRLVATMNNDLSTFNTPEYIESRLKPVITIEFPAINNIREILSHHMLFVQQNLIMAIIHYLTQLQENGQIPGYSIRDAIQITRFAQKLSDEPIISIDDIARLILNITEKEKTQEKSLHYAL